MAPRSTHPTVEELGRATSTKQSIPSLRCYMRITGATHGRLTASNREPPNFTGQDAVDDPKVDARPLNVVRGSR